MYIILDKVITCFFLILIINLARKEVQNNYTTLS